MNCGHYDGPLLAEITSSPNTPKPAGVQRATMRKGCFDLGGTGGAGHEPLTPYDGLRLRTGVQLAGQNSPASLDRTKMAMQGL